MESKVLPDWSRVASHDLWKVKFYLALTPGSHLISRMRPINRSCLWLYWEWNVCSLWVSLLTLTITLTILTVFCNHNSLFKFSSKRDNPPLHPIYTQLVALINEDSIRSFWPVFISRVSCPFPISMPPLRVSVDFTRRLGQVAPQCGTGAQGNPWGTLSREPAKKKK